MRQYAEKEGVDANLILAIIKQESSGRTHGETGEVLTSPAGARGLMQITPGAVKDVGEDPESFDYGDPDANIRVGTKYMARLLKKYEGNMELALAAYNAGMGNVKKHEGIPPFPETQKYVTAVSDTLSALGTEVVSTPPFVTAPRAGSIPDRVLPTGTPRPMGQREFEMAVRNDMQQNPEAGGFWGGLKEFLKAEKEPLGAIITAALASATGGDPGRAVAGYAGGYERARQRRLQEQEQLRLQQLQEQQMQQVELNRKLSVFRAMNSVDVPRKDKLEFLQNEIYPLLGIRADKYTAATYESPMGGKDGVSFNQMLGEFSGVLQGEDPIPIDKAFRYKQFVRQTYGERSEEYATISDLADKNMRMIEQVTGPRPEPFGPEAVIAMASQYDVTLDPKTLQVLASMPQTPENLSRVSSMVRAMEKDTVYTPEDAYARSWMKIGRGERPNELEWALTRKYIMEERINLEKKLETIHDRYLLAQEEGKAEEAVAWLALETEMRAMNDEITDSLLGVGNDPQEFAQNFVDNLLRESVDEKGRPKPPEEGEVRSFTHLRDRIYRNLLERFPEAILVRDEQGNERAPETPEEDRLYQLATSIVEARKNELAQVGYVPMLEALEMENEKRAANMVAASNREAGVDRAPLLDAIGEVGRRLLGGALFLEGFASAVANLGLAQAGVWPWTKAEEAAKARGAKGPLSGGTSLPWFRLTGGKPGTDIWEPEHWQTGGAKLTATGMASWFGRNGKK